MFSDIRKFQELRLSFGQVRHFEQLNFPTDNGIEEYCEPRNAAGLSCNQPINSNLSPPGNNPNQIWVTQPWPAP
jgi:hypothetical protein